MPFSRARVIAPEYDRIAPCAPSIGWPRGCDLNAFITFDRERAIASAHKATLDRLRAAGAELVDVDMPGLVDLNGKISFPGALYEARADPTRYLKRYRLALDLATLAGRIASPDVKGLFANAIVPGAKDAISVALETLVGRLPAP
jgi:Asp-tRNA(Asn)/Glu-tRNA(Gln) amidotransferase A subunit family amidase